MKKSYFFCIGQANVLKKDMNGYKNIKNKGTGAGGKNTNKNGLSFENEATNIDKMGKELSKRKYFKKLLFFNEKIFYKFTCLRHIVTVCRGWRGNNQGVHLSIVTNNIF